MAVIEAIATTYLEADASSVTFSSIPATYEHLQLRGTTSTDRDALHDMVKINLNSDTGSNYSRHNMHGVGSVSQASAQTSQDCSKGSWVSGATDDAAFYGSMLVDILDYAEDTNKNTTLLWTVGGRYNASGNVACVSGLWDNIAAVTSIVLAPYYGSNFLRGSEFTLYGLKSS